MSNQQEKEELNNIQKAKSSQVWKYWKQGNNIATCNFCLKQLKYKDSSTSNLWRHSNKLHSKNMSIEDQEEESNDEDQDSESETEVDNINEVKPQKKLIQSDLTHYRDLSKDKDSLLYSKILQHIIKDCRPINTVEKDGFVQIIKLFNPQYTMPSRFRIKNDIFNIHQTLTQQIIQIILQNQLSLRNNFSLQFDHWKSVQQENIISVSSSYISNNFQIQFINLSNFHASGGTGIEITTDLTKIIKKFGLTEQKKDQMIQENELYKIYVTSDGAPVNKFAIKDNYQIVCYLHLCNNALKAMEDHQHASNLLKKVKVVVKFFKNSFKRQQILKDIFLKNHPDQTFITPKKSSKIRFNSIHTMLESYLKNKQSFEEYTKTQNLIDKDVECIIQNLLSPEEETLANNIRKITYQFQQIFLCLQKRSIATLPLILPYHHSILDQILKIMPDDKKKIQELKKHILEQYLEKFNTHFKKSLIVIGISTFLHPQYRSFLKLKDFQLYKQILQQIKMEIIELIRQDDKINQNNKEEELSKQLKKIKINEQYSQNLNLLQLYQEDNMEIEYSKENDQSQLAENEIQQYINDKIEFENYNTPKRPFELYPYLQQLCKKYFSISATISESESNQLKQRIFSMLGNLVTKKRNKLKSDFIEAISFISMNLQYNTVTQKDIEKYLSRKYISVKKS